MSTLQHNISLAWPDPVLDFYPLGDWSPKHQQTSRGSWSSAENSGSSQPSGVHLSNFNATSLAVTGTTQWSDMQYNASLVPDGPVDNVQVQDVGDDPFYGFKNGNLLYFQDDLSNELKTFDLNENQEMQNSTYEAWTNVLDIELVTLTIEVPASDKDYTVVNQTLSLQAFNFAQDEWSLTNDTMTPKNDQAQLDLTFTGTNFFLVSGWAQEPGFVPLEATLDGVEQPIQGRAHSRQAWQGGVLLFFSGLKDGNHTLSVQASSPTTIQYGLVFKAGRADVSSHDASSASRQTWVGLTALPTLVILATFGLLY